MLRNQKVYTHAYDVITLQIDFVTYSHTEYTFYQLTILTFNRIIAEKYINISHKESFFYI